MDRTFSVIRRRPNIVDFVTPFVYGVDKYRLKWAANFDAGAWTPFIDSSNIGWRDDTINPMVIEMQQTTGMVRIVFDPANYGITDDQHFWLEFFHVDPMAAETQMSAPTLILPESAHHGIHHVTIHGDAPNAATVAGSLQIDLPRLMDDFRIHNDEAPGGATLYVATEANGPEFEVQPDPGYFGTFRATQGSIWVRGGGAVVMFSAVSTVTFPR